jgi:hypothetical protein
MVFVPSNCVFDVPRSIALKTDVALLAGGFLLGQV